VMRCWAFEKGSPCFKSVLHIFHLRKSSRSLNTLHNGLLAQRRTFTNQKSHQAAFTRFSYEHISICLLFVLQVLENLLRILKLNFCSISVNDFALDILWNPV
jgi:hypothetical protein